MRTGYLSSCSALLICALAARGAAVLRSGGAHPAEELSLDNQGMMHWADDAVAAAQQAVPALGRPDFSALDVQALEAHAKPAADWLREQLHAADASLAGAEQQAKQWLHGGEQEAVAWLGKSEAQIKAWLGQGGEMAQEWAGKGEEQAKEWLGKGEQQAKAWLSKGLVAVDGMQYERLVHPHFPKYSLRLAQDPLTHCDPDVKSYAGYLDVEDKHFWFSFFESRNKPSSDPVLLWLNGGPGCSSSTGSLFEGVGACVLAKNGTDTAYNKLSWSNKANLLVLDQPVNVGFSYSDGSNVNNSPLAAEDAYAFLQLFFAKFDQFSSNDFHIAAESYGGRYAPLFAAKIHEKNQKLQSSRFINTQNMAPKHIKLASVMLGNGLTEPQTQFASVPDYACKGKYAIFEADSPTCTKLYSKAATCSSLIGSCYSSNSRFTCLPAALYCWSGLYTDAQQSGLNLYDVRRKCDRAEDKDGPLCYKGLQDMEHYMNMPSTKKAYGVPASLEFKSCNMEINQSFMMQGDSTHNSAEVLPQLIADGVRVLVYAGEADFMCNAIGNERWLMKLEQPYHAELDATKPQKWVAGDKSEAGYVRAAGKGFGNVAYVRVANAGHMVPLDVPGPALEMVEAWLANKALV